MSKSNKNDKKNKKIGLITLITILLIAVVILAAVLIIKNKQDEEKNTLAYTDLIKELSYGNIEKIEMKTGSTTVKVKVKNVEEEKTSIVPEVESFMGLVQAKVAEGNEIELIQKPKEILSQIPGRNWFKSPEVS